MAETKVSRDISGVYVIRNTVSGRVYVGSSARVSHRWSVHRYSLRKGTHHCAMLQRSWMKHGEDAFVFDILEKVEREDDLFAREQFWIDKLNSTCPKDGFNIYPRAGGPRGYKMSTESRAKMSAARLGKKHPPRTASQKAAMSAAQRGRKVSEETRAKQRGRKASDKTRAKMRSSHIGKHREPKTAAHKEALRLAAIGRKATEQTRKNMSAAGKGRPKSPEHAARIGASNRLQAIARRRGQLELPI
jgi:group I intron endonuclease